ncbi:MAG TPA: tyrosine-protein phosphatase [Candidatus Nanoarchaeia archaeon]|nr:tyrosine-protein phosphatase [Candidatus Nanoarchaeia archaeon]
MLPSMRRGRIIVDKLLARTGRYHSFRSFGQVGDKFFRSGELRGYEVEEIIRSHGIRTVINLRGAKPNHGNYRAEVKLCRRLGVMHHDIHWHANYVAKDALVAYVDLLHLVNYPLLVHCAGGKDRSGFAAAVYCMVMLGHDLGGARSELTKFGHELNGLDIMLDWFAASGNDSFEDWAKNNYQSLPVKTFK